MTTADLLLAGGIFAAVAVIASCEFSRASARREQRLAGLLQSNTPVKEPFWTVFAIKARKQMAKPEAFSSVTAAVAVFAAAGIFQLHALFTILLLATACPLAWFLMRQWRLRKLRRLFADRFPDAVDSLTRSVQAGVPIEKALAAIGESYSGELGRRFAQLVRQLELGIPFRDATKSFSDGLNMPDVNFFCAVLALNRESGSRLTPMLISLSRTLRERRAVGRKIKVMTSETRSAAKVLSLLPCLVLAMQFFLNPSHFEFLFYDPTGRFILGSCAGLMIAGIFIINRMSRLGGTE